MEAKEIFKELGNTQVWCLKDFEAFTPEISKVNHTRYGFDYARFSLYFRSVEHMATAEHRCACHNNKMYYKREKLRGVGASVFDQPALHLI